MEACVKNTVSTILTTILLRHQLDQRNHGKVKSVCLDIMMYWTVKLTRNHFESGKDGYIVGRGSNDNKGSTFACIYAMRFFKENNIHLKNNIRLLYGCNEEAGMEDIKYYGKKYGFPTLTIVPDSWFPISRSEKGVINLTVDAPVNSGNLLQFQAGTNGITIPNKAVCVISGYTLEQVQKAAKAYPNIHPSAHKNGVLITATGIAKHAAFPEGSVNAISVMASFLLAEGLVSGDAKMVLEFIAESLSDYEGKALNIDFHDDLAGKTSHTIAMIELINQRWKSLQCSLSGFTIH